MFTFLRDNIKQIIGHSSSVDFEHVCHFCNISPGFLSFPTSFIIKCFSTILAAVNYTFSSFSASCLEQPSQTSEAYSRIGLIKVIIYFDKFFLPIVNLSFLKALFTTLSMKLVQLRLSKNNRPK